MGEIKLMNGKRLIIIVFLFVVLSLPLFSAEQLVFKKETDMILSVPCTFNNTQCTSSAVCNYTLFGAPNQTRLFNSTVTLDENSFFFITIISSWNCKRTN